MRIGKMISTILQQDPLGVAGTSSGKNLREMITELSGKIEARGKAPKKKKTDWLSALSRVPLAAAGLSTGVGMAIGSALTKPIRERGVQRKKERSNVEQFGISAPNITASLRTRGYDEQIIQEYIDVLAEWYGAEKLDISKIKI